MSHSDPVTVMSLAEVEKKLRRNNKLRWTSLIIGTLLFLSGVVTVVINASGAPTTDTANMVSVSALLDAANSKQLKEATVTNHVVDATTVTGQTLKASIPGDYDVKVIDTLIANNVNVSGTNPTVRNNGTVRSATETSPPFPISLCIFLLIAGLAGLVTSVLLWINNATLTTQKETAVKEAEKTNKTGGADDTVDIPETKFSDVAGSEEAVASMEELVDFLKNPEKYKAVGANTPSGALLVGPPGTGKTLLARAVAGEAGAPFYAAAASDFVELYVGNGAKKVRELFEKAKRHDKALIFIDEIDAVGKARSEFAAGGDSERDNTLIALLNELDGFHSSNIIILAATNRADILDKALTRPGRLDKQIQVPLPDRRGREQILRVHATKRPVETDLDFEHYARRTPGFSGADLAQLVNEAATQAARNNDTIITAECFDHAVAVVAMGVARKSAVVTDFDRKITAYHEAGHTLAALCEKDANPPVHVSIVPRGPAGGLTWMAESDDLFLTRSGAWARLTVALGGREAEKILLKGDYTSGASSDLDNATQTATAMLTRYGMENTLVTSATAEGAAGARENVDKMLHMAANRCGMLLTAYNEVLEGLAQGLLDADDLTHKDIDKILYDTTGCSREGFHQKVIKDFGNASPVVNWLETVS